MHLGILKTDAVRPEWVPTYGEYPDMFQRLLKTEDPSLEFTVWDVEQGDFPDTTDGVDGFLITGSKSSVYEDKAWIRELEAFVRRLDGEGRKTVGICFGHQVVAKALGGVVDKSPKGWGVGIHCYEVADPVFAADTEAGQLCLVVSHQDQVMTLPDGFSTTVSNQHCEIAGLKKSEHILTFQGHPEFIPDYAREIMNFRQEIIGDERVGEGMASLEHRQHEGDRVARWILDFYRS